jgi:tRNA G10  N-methylase Trm11
LETHKQDKTKVQQWSYGWIGLTSHVQDATSWSERDFDKPFRDAKTGMLPPKLARMMLNMALGTREARTSTLLDPFCGSGTVLLEGMAIGMPRLHGNDLDDRQVAGATKNVHWLKERHHMQTETTFSTQAAERLAGVGTFDVIVTEGYLGKPLRGHEPTAFLNAQKHEVEAIWNEALPRFGAAQPAGGTLVCTTPAYLLSTGTLAVDIREAARAAGYRAEGSWLYQRPDQRVARQVQRFQKT